MADQAEATRRLRQQAELIDLVPEAVLVRDVEGARIRYWNRGAEQMYGWSSDDALGQVSHELLGTEFPSPLAEIEAAVSTRGSWQGDLRQRTRDGRHLLVTSRWALQRDDQTRQPLAYLEVNKDVTEERASSEQLRRLLRETEAAELKFRGLLEAAPDAIIIVDPNGLIDMVNKQAEQLFGYARAEMIGQAIDILLPLQLRDVHVQHRASYAAAPRTRPMGVGLDLLGLRKDGTEFPVEISLSPIASEGRTLVISTVRDVTERKRGEEQLRATAEELARSNTELEQFAYVASHDLQEPLRMVASYTQLLARRYAGKLDQDADEFIGFAVDGALRMQELINDLLSFSRVGTRPLQIEDVDTGRLVDEILHDLSTAIEEQRAKVTVDALPVVRGDRSQLRQLFQNLIANGIKFSRPDNSPHVHVSAQPGASVWTFAVRDNGIGIEPQYVDRIFVLFQRLHSRADYPGTGIGLALCKKIVERHHGRIWLASQPGEGTTFFFTLPANLSREASSE